MTPVTRTFCPLCDWHHDSTDAELTMPAPGMSIEEHAEQTLMAHYAGLEVIVREHLESHPLIEWIKKVNQLQQSLASAETDVQLAMDEWGKSDRHHAEKSVAMAAERGSWGTTRQRVWNAAFVADEEDVTDWQRGYRACSVRVMAALDEPDDLKIYDFNAPLRTPATPDAADAPASFRDRLLAKHPVTLAELDAEPDPNALPNAEDCPQCTDPNPPYPFICPGHPAEGALAPDCRWPACLSEDDQQLLAEQIGASMLGEATALMPDPRPGCGCVDRGVGRAWVAGGPDCGFPSVPPRKHSAELQQQVAERFGFPLRTPATGGEQQ